MNTPQDAAGPLYEALLAEAQQWACDDAEDQEVLAAIDHAPTLRDKVALLQNSSLVPAGLASAVADALLVLDPATYSPSPVPSPPGTFLADPELHRIRDASITVVDASPEDNTPSDAYEIQVFGRAYATVRQLINPDADYTVHARSETGWTQPSDTDHQ